MIYNYQFDSDNDHDINDIYTSFIMDNDFEIHDIYTRSSLNNDFDIDDIYIGFCPNIFYNLYYIITHLILDDT